MKLLLNEKNKNLKEIYQRRRFPIQAADNLYFNILLGKKVNIMRQGKVIQKNKTCTAH
jgi:hypothetical protein